MVESEQLFLDNQQEYQRLNQQITQLEEEVRQLEVQKRTVEESLSQQRRPAYDEFKRQMERHNLRIAMWKLSVLLPVVIKVGFVMLKYMAWTKRSLRRVSRPCMADIPVERYTCPACTTELYSVCASCGSIRHTLLPACTKCGSQIPIGTMPSQ